MARLVDVRSADGRVTLCEFAGLRYPCIGDLVELAEAARYQGSWSYMLAIHPRTGRRFLIDIDVDGPKWGDQIIEIFEGPSEPWSRDWAARLDDFYGADPGSFKSVLASNDPDALRWFFEQVARGVALPRPSFRRAATAPRPAVRHGYVRNQRRVAR